jgi:hypothetical protein
LLAPQCGNSISQLRGYCDVGFVCQLPLQRNKRIGKLYVTKSHRSEDGVSVE